MCDHGCVRGFDTPAGFSIALVAQLLLLPVHCGPHTHTQRCTADSHVQHAHSLARTRAHTHKLTRSCLFAAHTQSRSRRSSVVFTAQHTHTHTHTHMHTYTCIHTHTHTHTCIHTHAYVHMHTHTLHHALSLTHIHNTCRLPC